ncbi:hypothetical protein L226DRAFT_573081 [Lentinus tigrinus ALCF2SS1-7]|uniref:uncharacterized protein n=1 Tax=Lentinus tigrinus ALCF2SS1-7 TaxID=1328758 RepID=UPI0011662485|nr:hypothetical protein L226DRAFT_573081 [Lentinus tigrinus ALCF2SS1-7]
MDSHRNGYSSQQHSERRFFDLEATNRLVEAFAAQGLDSDSDSNDDVESNRSNIDVDMDGPTGSSDVDIDVPMGLMAGYGAEDMTGAIDDCLRQLQSDSSAEEDVDEQEQADDPFLEGLSQAMWSPRIQQADDRLGEPEDLDWPVQYRQPRE